MISQAAAAAAHPNPPDITTSQPPAAQHPHTIRVIERDHRDHDGVETVRVPCTPSDVRYPNTKEGWLARIKDDPEGGMDAYLEASIQGTLPDGATSESFMSQVGQIAQKHNREVTLQSNLANALHETRKAALQNIRV